MKKKGFTLVEVIATLAVFTILSAAVYGVMADGLKTYNKELTKVEIENNGRYVLQSISESIKKSKSVNLENSPSKIIIRNHDELKDITYSLQDGKLYKESSDARVLVGSNIESLSIDYSKDEKSSELYSLEVEIKEKDATRNFSTVVTLRNRGEL